MGDLLLLPVPRRAPEKAVDEPFEVEAAPGMVSLEIGVPALATEHWMTSRRARLLAAELLVMADTADRMEGEGA